MLDYVHSCEAYVLDCILGSAVGDRDEQSLFVT